jgi:MOSC domain-containing protein YiiM/catechol 2,3-dioxygenase-like lactoylglutathione lyase family enzyme
MSEARIHRINVSKGGVPKLPVAEGRVTVDGLAGDAHAKPDIHGGPDQALSLFSLERIEALAAEGHPISAGSTGENVTVRGLDWSGLRPGTRLRLGPEVEIEITRYADPCRTIAGSFSDGGFHRMRQMRVPGGSRLYAKVLREGRLRTGDPVQVLAPDSETRTERSPRMELAYVNVYVTDLERSVRFFEKTLGLALQFSDARFGYASLDAGPVRIGLARIDPEDPESRALVGRQTGVGFAVPDLKASHADLARRGVAFPMEPAVQPWGAMMALFSDPDGNVFYLDQLREG